MSEAAPDPHALSAPEAMRILNSTPAARDGKGPVCRNQYQMLKSRDAAGFPVCTRENKIDLFHLAGWLFDQLVIRKRRGASVYERIKSSQAERNRQASQEGRDIGPIPPVANPERKEACRFNFRLYCETYSPDIYNLTWSPDHLRVIERIETAVLHGGLFALAMPRGSGKSSLSEDAVKWATSYGHTEFVALIGSDAGHAEDMLESIKTDFETNELLLQDFPEISFPVVSLEGIMNRGPGQTCLGKRTRIRWTSKEVVFPTIEGSEASAAIIKVAGITGRIRGMKFKRSDGRTVRPRLVIIDDPQTDDSAKSLTQCQSREAVLAGAVLGLAGPGQKISGVMPCTVIRPGDMADNILDRDKHPEWNGERTRMMNSFPTNDALWEKYAVIRAESLRKHGDIRDATTFYADNREAMDEGAEAAWEQRFNHDELSAIQNAMNLKLQDEAAFFAEYQNDPIPVDDNKAEMLTAEQIAALVNNYDRNRVPLDADTITCFVDVQQKLLYYAVIAWRQDFTGYVLDYGSYPDQKRIYFTLRDVRYSLGHAKPGAGVEGAIFAGLETLVAALTAKEYERDDGAQMKIAKLLIDANWGTSTDVVYQFCRQFGSNTVMPTHGRFVGASSVPFSEYSRRPGELVGHNWRIPQIRNKRAIRHVLYDTNYWKSFVHQRLATAVGDPGSLTLFGKEPAHHRLVSEHLTAEYYVETEGRGRKVDEWKLRPNAYDNHWLDCFVGCAVGASMQGSALSEAGMAPPAQQTRKRVSLPGRRSR